MNALATYTSEAVEIDLLLIEDCDADVTLTVAHLTAAGFACRHRVVATEPALREALRERLPSLILADYTLPGFGGFEALELANQTCPEVPFVFHSGTIGEEQAVEALHRGAIDYVLKSNPQRLAPAVRRALAEAQLRKATHRAERRVTRLTSVLQMLSGINTAVVRIRDRSSLLNEACRLAHTVGGYALAMISMVDSTTRTVRPVASSGPPVGTWPGPPALAVADTEGDDTSIVGRVVRSGEPVLCDDLAGPSVPINGRDRLIEVGIRAIACVPLTIDGTPVGAFFFASGEAGLLGDEELKLLRELAGNLSFALQFLDQKDAAHFLTYFDPLTGLAKRALFCERLGRLLIRGADRLPQIAVNVFDIHHLSVINDTFGRHTGDRLLQCVGDRLKAHCSDTDRLAHLGGGTFVSFTAVAANAAAVQELRRNTARLFDAPLVIEGREIAITIRSGVACYPQNGATAHELVQNAEAALKQAKSSGEKYLHHRLEMNSALAAQAGMEIRLRTALQNEQFVLHYQPKLRIETGRIAGAEALLRWQDPERGLVAPGEFLPILESAGLLPAVTGWALARAAADCRKWRTAGLPAVRVAVNIPPADLRRRGFVRELLSAIGSLREHDGWGIDIEVTEGALYGDSSDCVHALRLLRSAGVGVAIDDFGTGYSSLARLSDLPIDSLKIDRTFVSRLPADQRVGKLVATVIELAHAFGMTTVAEGVETRQQLELLRQFRCDESQGFIHSKAVPEEELARMLERPPGT